MKSSRSAFVSIVLAVFLSMSYVELVTGQNSSDPGNTTTDGVPTTSTTIGIDFSTMSTVYENNTVSGKDTTTTWTPLDITTSGGNGTFNESTTIARHETSEASESPTTSTATSLGTETPSSTLSTAAPPASSTTPVDKGVQPSASGFDGLSFLGGIILALGLIVILVIAVKCYRQRARNNELHYSQF